MWRPPKALWKLELTLRALRGASILPPRNRPSLITIWWETLTYDDRWFFALLGVFVLGLCIAGLIVWVA